MIWIWIINMKLTKTRLKQIIKEEITKLHICPEAGVELPPMAYKDDEEEKDFFELYDTFTERGWSPSDEKALLAFARDLFVSHRLNPNDHYRDLAELYKEYIAPTQDVFYTRKAEVEQKLADLESKVRTDKPYMTAGDRSVRNKLDREISDLRMLNAILNEL